MIPDCISSRGCNSQNKYTYKIKLNWSFAQQCQSFRVSKRTFQRTFWRTFWNPKEHLFTLKNLWSNGKVSWMLKIETVDANKEPLFLRVYEIQRIWMNRQVEVLKYVISIYTYFSLCYSLKANLSPEVCKISILGQLKTCIEKWFVFF